MIKFDFSRLTYDFLLSSVQIPVKFSSNSFSSVIVQKKFKGHEKRDRLLISKWTVIFQISQRNKNLTY